MASVTSPLLKRTGISVTGVVQGVGFRPFVYGLAHRLGLTGAVCNTGHGVDIEIEGPEESIQSFITGLGTDLPVTAQVTALEAHRLPVRGSETFTIVESMVDSQRAVLITPDVATCAECLRELTSATDRRYGYPFINCAHCGPRYTIISDMPYDRVRTSMAAFPMCPACRKEYEDPANRRFHAEATCCRECGPKLWLTDKGGGVIGCEDPIQACREFLRAGQVVAIKGLGGFHLACDATNESVVQSLRERKGRGQKPFAVMVRDVASAHTLAHLSPLEAEILESSASPIVLAERLTTSSIAPSVAPGCGQLGLFLPYTPVHYLLTAAPMEPLVMTSGNFSEEPITCDNEVALKDLGTLADCFLLHDRAIISRADDSVGRVLPRHGLRMLRRSRGYAPLPIALPVEGEFQPVLAVGPELNNTVCLTRGSQAFLSQHIGDLRNASSYEAFLATIRQLQQLLGVKPAIVAADLHPDYLATLYARQSGLTLVNVPHHHAHIAAVLAEHGRTGPVVSVACDGLGWGPDDTLWGGEFLVADLAEARRAGCFQPLPLPGGDAAARKPARMAYAILAAVYGGPGEFPAERLLPELPENERRLLDQMLANAVRCPLTSSVGRLFDAAGALVGACQENTFEGQTPMALEKLACDCPDETGCYRAEIVRDEAGLLVIRTTDIFHQLADDLLAGVPPPRCAARFHNALVQSILEVCREVCKTTGLNTVALGGGVFVNAILTTRLTDQLQATGVEVLSNQQVPAGDGGISLGQAAVAVRRQSCV